MFKKGKASKKEPMDVDITSLLDILVILLVFLLKSYNASDLSVDVVKNLNLPVSSSTKLGNFAIVVQVDKRGRMFVDNKRVKNVTYKTEKIEALYKILEEKKAGFDKAREIASVTEDQTKKLKRNVNILLDQSQPYEVMQKIMHTAATAGFSKFKFIVQGSGE